MDDAQGGPGTSRSTVVLDPSFVEGLDTLALEEVRRRRNQALAEREFLSYLRRLVQVRRDVLAAEQRRRLAGAPMRPIVEQVTAVLAAGPQGRGRGEALRLELPEEDAEEAERRMEAMLGGVSLTYPERLQDDTLAQALATLTEHERSISADRAAVIAVHDRFQDELKRRFREDPRLALQG